MFSDVDTFVVPCQHIREYPTQKSDQQNGELSVSVKRYIPSVELRTGSKRLKIIAAGGNGFSKELYEPLWEDMVNQSSKAGISIDAIIIADIAHQGQSAGLNNHEPDHDPSWFDNARDLLRVVDYFRAELTGPLVAVGHSIGATALINLATFHPRLFSHLLLIEPILGDCTGEGLFYAHHTLHKPDKWASREDAMEYTKTTPPFLTWDHRVVERWLDYGLISHTGPDSPAVSLATSREQEARTYVRSIPTSCRSEGVHRQNASDYIETIDGGRNFYCPAATITMARRIPELRPPVSYVFGEKSVMSSEARRRALLEQTGKGIGGSGGGAEWVKMKIIASSGHLLPFERPKECAHALLDAMKEALEKGVEEQAMLYSQAGTTHSSEAWAKMVDRDFLALRRSRAEKL